MVGGLECSGMRRDLPRWPHPHGSPTPIPNRVPNRVSRLGWVAKQQVGPQFWPRKRAEKAEKADRKKSEAAQMPNCLRFAFVRCVTEREIQYGRVGKFTLSVWWRWRGNIACDNRPTSRGKRNRKPRNENRIRIRLSPDLCHQPMGGSVGGGCLSENSLVLQRRRFWFQFSFSFADVATCFPPARKIGKTHKANIVSGEIVLSFVFFSKARP